MPLHEAPSITRVARFGLVVSDLHESERFFVDAFDFVATGRGETDAAFADLMGMPEAMSRFTTVTLGDQEIVLLQFDPLGRPYPPGSTSSDLWFQHFAIIVSDMAKAYAQLEAAGRFAPISQGGPVTLPGGIEAFKFRDLDGHPLELLAFPKDGGPEYWQQRRSRELFLGIDHSAISVGDTNVCKRFFEGCFGLKKSEQTHNQNPAQSRPLRAGDRQSRADRRGVDRRKRAFRVARNRHLGQWYTRDHGARSRWTSLCDRGPYRDLI